MGVLFNRMTPAVSTSLMFLLLVFAAGCHKHVRPGSDDSSGGLTCPDAVAVEAGSWHPAVQLDAGNGGYGSAAYSPAGDLFTFYAISTVPDQLKLIVRRNGNTAFDSPVSVMSNGRTANPFFSSSGAILLAVENFGTACVYESLDNGATWDWQVSYVANDPIASGAYHQAFLTESGGSRNLFYGYTYHNAVFGDSNRLYGALQSGGSWPGDSTSLAPSNAIVNGVQGAYQIDSKVLVVATKVFSSGNGGSSFTQVMNSGSIPNDITYAAASARNPHDGTVYAANNYTFGVSPAYHVKVWTTADLGDSFTASTVFDSTSIIYRVALAASQNVSVLALSTGLVSENEIWISVSIDNGDTWSELSPLVDLSGTGQTVNALSLAASCGGRVSLVYSVESAGNRQGVYIIEYY